MKHIILFLALCGTVMGQSKPASPKATVPNQCKVGTVDLTGLGQTECGILQAAYARGHRDQKSQDWTPFSGPAWREESCIVGDMKLPDPIPRIACGLANSAYQRGYSNGQHSLAKQIIPTRHIALQLLQVPHHKRRSAPSRPIRSLQMKPSI